MKKYFLLSMVFTLCGVKTFAQQKIEYKILVDSPGVVPSNFVYLYYFDYFGRMSNAEKRHRAVRGLGASINAFHHITKDEAVEFSFHMNHSDLRSSARKYPIKTDAAFNHVIGRKSRSKGVRINIRAFKTVVEVNDQYGNFRGFHDAIGVEQIEVPGTEGLTRYARAGLLYQNGSYDRQKPKELGTYHTGAVFVGFAQESRINVDVQLLNRTSRSAQYMRTYFDLMYFPLATTTADNKGKKSALGFRIGGLGHFPGMKNFMNYMAPKVEIGINALDGWYWQVGLGFNVYKS